MTKNESLTKSYIEALPLPAQGKRKYYHDGKVRGLAICITGSGSKTWYLYRWVLGKPQQVRIGEYPGLSIEQARKRAEELNARIAQGEDPADNARRRKAEWTFGELFDWYMETHAKVRKRSWVKDEYLYKRHLTGLARTPISKISRGRLREIHAAIGKENGIYTANRTLALLSVVYNKAIAFEHWGGPNPAKGIEPFKEESRDRRLTADELPAFFQALAEDPSEVVRDFFLLLLFTGARKSNLLAMRWDEIDFYARTWRIPKTKSGSPQLVPLEDMELEVLRRRKEESDSPWVFAVPHSKSGHLVKPDPGWRRILKRAGLKNLRIHDLRRSLGSWMADTGASIPTIGKALHHQSQQTTAIYARMSLDPVRLAKTKAINALISAGELVPDKVGKQDGGADIGDNEQGSL